MRRTLGTTELSIVRSYLLRGSLLWLLARLLISVVIVAAHGDPLALPVRSSVIIVLVSTTLALAQTARLHEGTFLGNLGVSRALLACYFALPALLGELLIGVTGASFA